MIPPLPTRPDVVLFDLDGTLCDSVAGIVEHLAAALTTVGLAVPPQDALLSCVGPRWDQGFPPEVGVPADRTWDVIEAYRRTYDLAAPTLAHPFPGITEVLDRLRAAGTEMAVATSKPHDLATRIVVDGPLAGSIPTVLGWASEHGRHDKADVIGAALGHLGVDETATAVMVGDRHHDVHGAAVHGVATVGVTWGAAGPGELEDAGARAVVHTPAALADLLLGV